jgi:hypothetical protein
MSTLSMRLKQRARMLAAGVALSAATLALIPGVAEATDPTDCLCGLVNDITNTEESGSGGSGGSQPSGGNSAEDNIGAVQLSDSLNANDADIASNNQTNLLTDESNNTSSGGNTSGSGGSQPSGDSNSAKDNIGAVQGNDFADANNTDVLSDNQLNVGTNDSRNTSTSPSGSGGSGGSGPGDSGSGPGDGGSGPGDGGNGPSGCETAKCNSGNGNKSEAGDPGNSEDKNRGGDEVGSKDDSDANPGGNNNNDTSGSTSDSANNSTSKKS